MRANARNVVEKEEYTDGLLPLLENWRFLYKSAHGNKCR